MGCLIQSMVRRRTFFISFFLFPSLQTVFKKIKQFINNQFHEHCESLTGPLIGHKFAHF